jgi:hypothetical protein
VQLARNFALSEFSVSASRPDLATGVPERLVGVVQRLARHVLQPIRDEVGPMTGLSGYRSPDLNRAIGGSETSQHLLAEAFDFAVDGTLLQAWRRVRRLAADGALWCAGQIIVYPSRGFIHAALLSPRYPRTTLCLHEPRAGFRYEPIRADDDGAWGLALHRAVGGRAGRRA